MKYFILVVVAWTQISCATKNSSNNEDYSITDLVKSNQQVYIENQTINAPIDFTSFLNAHLISEGIYQVNVNSGLTFKNCIFNQSVTAYKSLENGKVVLTAFKGNVTFIDCIFKEDVNFRGSSIFGRADFTGTTFTKSATFEELGCHENAYFNKTIFEGTSRFQNSFFNQKANFLGAEFFDNISFQNSVFNSELQFSAAKFYKYADFSLIDCRAKVLFNYSEFNNKVDFSQAVFVQDFDFVNTKNRTTHFNNCRFLGNVRFNKMEVATNFSLKGSYFLLETPKLDLPSHILTD